MKLFAIIRAALVFGLFSISVQSASAAACGSQTGSPPAHTATEYFLNAVNNTCGSSAIGVDPSNDGHIIVGGSFYVSVQFIENGALFTPTNRSLSCGGGNFIN
ncbi:MAG TPA: hypothetical protein EYG79_03035 [Rhodobacteraceae bacterium]|nr:hypothetical protein [Paracoccaceae bacterium]